MEKKYLYVVYPDDDRTTYKYSDGLFDWFYDRVRYTGEYHEKWESGNYINLKQTKEDNNSNGCRIRYNDGCYTKYCDTYFLMEFTESEWDDIFEGSVDGEIKTSDVVNYYYQIKLGD